MAVETGSTTTASATNLGIGVERSPMAGRLIIVAAAAFALQAALISDALSQAKPVLDFEFFKSRVEPVFLKKKTGHTRCVVCHAESNNNFRLEKLTAGSNTWTDEQSRKNFEMVAKLVNPGDPATSRLLMQPLAPEGGGNVYHSGGRQFTSKSDPDWKLLAQWVNGTKPATPSRK